MKTRSIIITGMFTAALLALALYRPAPAVAVSAVTSSSAGDGVFLVEGVGIENAAALEINVVYDITTLANPRVAAGPLISGAMIASNPNVPGTVRMVIIRLTPVQGSGVIATLTFDRKGSSPGTLLSLNAKLANIGGTSIPVIAQVNNPPDTSTSDMNASQGQETIAVAKPSSQAGAGTTAPTIIVAGLPGRTEEAKPAPEIQGTKQTDDQTVPPEPDRAQKEERAATERKTDGTTSIGDVATGVTASTQRIYTQKSILERFKEYKGERTLEAFISLFEQDGMSWCRQDPPVALSDGKTAVRVTFISTPENTMSSDVAVMGAKLISVKKDSDKTNTWVVELVPEKGEYRASLAVSQGEIRMVYPLTIAPKVAMDRSQTGTMTKADFNRYVSGRGTASPPKFDAIPDNKRDYINDYIITANYLAAPRTAQNPTSK